MQFFDHNATTPLHPEAKKAWLAAAGDAWLNPSSPYRAAAKVRVKLEAAREAFAEFLGVSAARVVFNSGATEGNNAVFAHWAEQLPSEAKIALSPTEHPSVLAAAQHHFAGRVTWLKLDEAGAIDLAAAVHLIQSESIAAVSVMAANNETGILNPWTQLAHACRSEGILYHCDASQWVGKLPVDELGCCDYVTGCSHKFGGPGGVGFIILASNQMDFQSLLGGAQEQGHRAGTENVAGVLAMLAAYRATAREDVPAIDARDDFIASVRQAMPQVDIIGERGERLWNTVSVVMPDFASVRWIRALEKRGFLVSAGSACSTGKEGPSHVLAAMGLDANSMRRVLRISAGRETSHTSWQELARAIADSYETLRAEAADSNSSVIQI